MRIEKSADTPRKIREIHALLADLGLVCIENRFDTEWGPIETTMDLVRRIEELEKRIKELEAKK